MTSAASLIFSIFAHFPDSRSSESVYDAKHRIFVKSQGELKRAHYLWGEFLGDCLKLIFIISPSIPGIVLEKRRLANAGLRPALATKIWCLISSFYALIKLPSLTACSNWPSLVLPKMGKQSQTVDDCLFLIQRYTFKYKTIFNVWDFTLKISVTCDDQNLRKMFYLKQTSAEAEAYQCDQIGRFF